VVGLGAIDGVTEPLASSLDRQSAWGLSKRLSYVLLRQITPEDISAYVVGKSGEIVASMERNGRGETVVDCIEHVAAALEQYFGPVVRRVPPVPALLRYVDLTETKVWHRADGMDPIEILAIVRGYTGVKNLWSRSMFGCEFPILEMGHLLFLIDSLSGKHDQARHVARVMQWPEGGPEDFDALVRVVLECLAVLLGLPFALCAPSTPLAEMFQYSVRPSEYYPVETRVGAAVAALTWLWSAAGRRKAKQMMRTGHRCFKDSQGVAGWVAKWA